jgi:hypothetical protein
MAREKVITRSSDAGDLPMVWTPSQRRTLLVIVSVFLMTLLIRAGLNREYVSNPQSPHPPLAERLDARLDPNVATLAELMVLPQLGEKRAGLIVTFRDEYLQRHPSGTAFHSVEDLLQIKGIGPAMVETLRPHLKSAPATKAAR